MKAESRSHLSISTAIYYFLDAHASGPGMTWMGEVVPQNEPK